MSNYIDDSGLIFFRCDNCGRRLNGITYHNGMAFCAKCYQETFGETDKDRKIADLEAKLVEKDLRIEELEGQFAYECECNKEFVTCQNENEQLKQQLAEKEKSFDWIYYKWQECVERQTKAKTEFAIQQLSRARNRINSFRHDENKCLNKEDSIEDCLEVLDKTIMAIKELEGECETKEV